MTDQNHEVPEIPELRSLPREAAPPPRLEERVVAELHRAGLLHARGGFFRSRLVHISLAAAASVLLFLAGWLAAASQKGAPAPVPPLQPTYALLLRPGPDYREGTAADEQQRVKEYGAWARGLHQEGRLVSGEKLNDEARTLIARDSAVAFLEQPQGNGKQVQGFFLIRADNLDQALEIARECPHLRHGGIIEVRAIDPT